MSFIWLAQRFQSMAELVSTRDHKQRHFVAAMMERLAEILDEAAASNDWEATKNPDVAFRSLLDASNEALSRAIKDVQAGRLGWWRTANELKNRGLYIQWKNGHWVAPWNVGRFEYVAALKHTGRIRVLLRALERGARVYTAERHELVRSVLGTP